MARKRQSKDLYVYMNGIRVGTLLRETSGQLIFTYDPAWLTWKNTRPISLSMPLTELSYKGSIVENYFDNLLPDSESIRQRIQARFSASSRHCFDLLSYIGGDCVGALQLLTNDEISNVKKINADPIDDKDIAILLKHYQVAPLGMDRDLDFRISIAGAQEKTALLLQHGKWYLPHGTTPTSHIIKLPIGIIKHSGIDLSESTENEWLCLQILSAYNLPVNQAQIIRFGDIKTLVVERFDRRWSDTGNWLMRLPQEDMCQALGTSPGLKYESDGGPGIKEIMKILASSQDAIHDREKFMKSVFLFWILGAIDGHAKNFSINIEAQGRYQLSPLYDVISAYPIAEKKQIEWKKLKMAMAVKSQHSHYLWSTIQLRHWLEMAKQCQFSEKTMHAIINDVCNNMEKVISSVTEKLPPRFPTHIKAPIFNGMLKMRDRCRI